MLINNIFCATQDVAIDSLAVSTLKPDERASGNGFMFGGQYLGIALGGGAAIYIYGVSSFEFALIYVSVLQFLCLLYVLIFLTDPKAQIAETIPSKFESIVREFIHKMTEFTKEVYRSFWQSGPAPKLGFLFSVLPTGALVLAYAALSTIPVDYGFNESQIAQITTMNTITAAVGCVVGGLLADKYGLRKMLGLYYILTTLPGLFLAYNISTYGLTNVPAEYIAGALILHGLLYGMAFGAQAAIFMGLTNPAVAATQFTAFMAMGNLVITYTNTWQGMVAERFDYSLVLYIDAFLVLVPLMIIPYLRSREEAGILTPAHQ
jgi:PAT family beta-lactamase induction signal transducer AmpG